MSPTLTLILYCTALVVASLVGGALPMMVRLTHKRMELALSFISGVMLGVAALLLLPHAFEARLVVEQPEFGHGSDVHDLGHGLLGPIMMWMLAGFLAMFFIERFFSFHHHAAPGEPDAAHAGCGHDHGHGHEHHHHDDHDHGHVAPAAHALRWSGAAVGLALHSLIDGVALAVSVAAGSHGGGAALAGLGAFLVIVLHKPFDSLTLGTLMAAGRQPTNRRHVVNALFALLTPIGAAAFMLGLAGSEHSQALILSIALAFAAGTFLCIALSDLLPELQFHQHDRVKLSIALIAGLAVAWGIARMEVGTHVHDAIDEHAGHSH